MRDSTAEELSTLLNQEAGITGWDFPEKLDLSLTPTEFAKLLGDVLTSVYEHGVELDRYRFARILNLKMLTQKWNIGQLHLKQEQLGHEFSIEKYHKDWRSDFPRKPYVWSASIR